MKRFQNYIKDVIVEMKKVTWPTWDELRGATIAVIVFSLISAAYMFGLDFILLKLVGLISDLMGA